MRRRAPATSSSSASGTASTTRTSWSLPMSQMLFSTSKSWPSSEKTPAVVTCSITGPLEDHDRAQHLAPLHLVEGVFHLVEADRLRHEPVEVEPALEVQVDEQREVT